MTSNYYDGMGQEENTYNTQTIIYFCFLFNYVGLTPTSLLHWHKHYYTGNQQQQQQQPPPHHPSISHAWSSTHFIRGVYFQPTTRVQKVTTLYVSISFHFSWYPVIHVHVSVHVHFDFCGSFCSFVRSFVRSFVPVLSCIHFLFHYTLLRNARSYLNLVLESLWCHYCLCRWYIPIKDTYPSF